MKASDDKTNVITKPVRVTYLFALRPYKQKAMGGNEAKLKYKVTALFPKDRYDMSPIKRAIKEAINRKFGDRPPKKLKMPINDGDDNEDENMHGFWTITASSETKPEVLDEDGIACDDEAAIYSGCYGKLYLKAFGYDNESKGVSFAFNAFYKVKDGKRLSGRMSAREAFGLDEEEEQDEDAPRKAKRPREDDDDDYMPKKRGKFDYGDEPKKRRHREEVNPDDF